MQLLVPRAALGDAPLHHQRAVLICQRRARRIYGPRTFFSRITSERGQAHVFLPSPAQPGRSARSGRVECVEVPPAELAIIVPQRPARQASTLAYGALAYPCDPAPLALTGPSR